MNSTRLTSKNAQTLLDTLCVNATTLLPPNPLSRRVSLDGFIVESR
jgi:hypothetical protein